MRWSNMARLLFSDEGRISRRDFWRFGLVALALAVVAILLAGPRRMVLAHAAYGIVMLYPSYCVFAKRLQDIDMSGLWAVVIVAIAAGDLVGGLGGIHGLLGHPAVPAWGRTGWSALSNANIAVVFAGLGVIPGTAGANRYGPMPGQ